MKQETKKTGYVNLEKLRKFYEDNINLRNHLPRIVRLFNNGLYFVTEEKLKSTKGIALLWWKKMGKYNQSLHSFVINNSFFDDLNCPHDNEQCPFTYATAIYKGWLELNDKGYVFKKHK